MHDIMMTMDVSWVLLLILQCDGHSVLRDKNPKIEKLPPQKTFSLHGPHNKSVIENISKQQFVTQSNATFSGHIPNNHAATTAPKTMGLLKTSRPADLWTARF